MEGATGVVRWEQVSADKADYAFGCAMQRHDLLTVVEAAFEFGATEILVNDSHARMINLDVRQLPKGVTVVSGAGKPLSMVEAVEGADRAFFSSPTTPWPERPGPSSATISSSVPSRRGWGGRPPEFSLRR
ncbi:MAG: M55 family metallopeptidase [Synergistaceae bacterium]|jgi:D-amino peptidase|nr:M55 family metallopeptidase [Synergistaceae bacterium]